jgi:hypothetical protein
MLEVIARRNRAALQQSHRLLNFMHFAFADADERI